MNAVTTLAATYVLLLYLAEMTGELLPLFNCHYFDSKYNYPIAAWGQLEALPDFPDSALKDDSLYKYINDDILFAKDGFTIEYKAKSQSESTVKKV